MDLSKMTNYALVLMSTRDPDGDMRKHTINELARRLEAAEAKAATYWAECEAWRAWHDDTSDRGTGWLMELATNVDKARAANDAARAANGEVGQ